GPAHNGWYLDIYPTKDQSPIRKAMHYQFPTTQDHHALPLFLFNGQTGKLLRAVDTTPLPEELIILYPQDADLALEGGAFRIEPQELQQLWNGWQYAVCDVEGHGALHYCGPDTTLHTRIEGKLSFSAASARDVPVLAGPQAPSWMRCMLSWPIFTAAKPHIRCQNEQWQYAIGELTRLDI